MILFLHNIHIYIFLHITKAIYIYIQHMSYDYIFVLFSVYLTVRALFKKFSFAQYLEFFVSDFFACSFIIPFFKTFVAPLVIVLTSYKFIFWIFLKDKIFYLNRLFLMLFHLNFKIFVEVFIHL